MRFQRINWLHSNVEINPSSEKKKMSIQSKRISHRITKFVEFFVQKGYLTNTITYSYYNSIIKENI